MTYDNHLASKLIASIDNEELVSKLLELDRPSLAEVHRRYETYVAGHAGARDLARAASARHGAVNVIDDGSDSGGDDDTGISAIRKSTYKSQRQGNLTHNLADRVKKDGSAPPAVAAGAASRATGREDGRQRQQTHQPCNNCGRRHAPAANCPAAKKRCNNCGKTGHFSVKCTAKLKTCPPC